MSCKLVSCQYKSILPGKYYCERITNKKHDVLSSSKILKTSGSNVTKLTQRYQKPQVLKQQKPSCLDGRLLIASILAIIIFFIYYFFIYRY